MTHALAYAPRYAPSVATTLRVSEHTRQRASSLAAASGASIGELVDRALDAYEKAAFWEATRRALRAGPDVVGEDTAWDRRVRDGLTGE